MTPASTLRNSLYLARADFQHLFRRWETWLWAFVLPVVFFYFIGTVTASFGDDLTRKDPIAILLPADAGFLGEQLAIRLENLGYRTAVVKTREELTTIFVPGQPRTVIFRSLVRRRSTPGLRAAE